jgi:hypothetical protein
MRPGRDGTRASSGEVTDALRLRGVMGPTDRLDAFLSGEGEDASCSSDRPCHTGILPIKPVILEHRSDFAENLRSNCDKE